MSASHQRRAGSRRLSTRTPVYVFGVFLVVAPQLIGGVHGWAIGAIIAALGLTLILLSRGLIREAHRGELPSLWWTLLFVWIFTVLQWMPLPTAVLSLLQPRALQESLRVHDLLDLPVAPMAALSLAPAATFSEVLKGAACLASFLCAWTLASVGYRRMVCLAIGWSAIGIAVMTLLHVGLGLDEVFGVYRPRDGGWLVAPLLNGNHLAGFLSLGLPILLAAAMEEADVAKRTGWLVAAAVVTACAVLGRSRAGTVALFLGAGLFGFWAWRVQRNQSLRRRSWVLAIPLLVSLGVALALFVAYDSVFLEFATGDLSKFALFEAGFELALRHPWVGVGRGAFSSAFVGQVGSTGRFTHPENLLVQWFSEWGFPVVLYLLVALCGALWVGYRRVRAEGHLIALGTVAGLLAFLFHDLFDFASEMLGISVVLSAALGALTSGVWRGDSGRGVVFWREPRWWTTGVGVSCLVAGLVFGPGLDGRTVPELQDALSRGLTDGGRRDFRALVERATRAYPLEPAFALLAGTEAARRGDTAGLRWLNRAMSLAPGWSAPHAETGRYLLRVGRTEQAYLEFREAESRLPGSTTDAVTWALEQRGELTGLARVALATAQGRAWLDRVASALPLASAAALAIDQELGPWTMPNVRLRGATRALDAGRGGDALQILGCDADAWSRDATRLCALAWVNVGERQRAEALLEALIAQHPADHRALRALASVYAGAGRHEDVQTVMGRLRRASPGNAHARALLYLFEGRLERRMGRSGAAIAAFERAERLSERSGALREIARESERLGNLRRAYSAYTVLCRRQPGVQAFCGAQQRLHQLLNEPSLGLPQHTGTP